MATRNQSNADFCNEVHEILARHESSIDEVHTTLQTVLTEIQSLRALQNQSQNQPETNPCAPTESSQHIDLASASHSQPNTDRNQHYLKLNFPMFSGDDPQDYEDPSKALTRLKQTSTVSIYQEEFKKLSHRVDGLPENFLIGCFIAGLKDEVRLDVKIKQPRSFTDAIGVARLVEEKNNLQKRGAGAFRPSILGTPPKSGNATPTGILGPPPGVETAATTNVPPITFKRITSQEARERREKGLCYYCDEKFVAGHRC
ncbi:hypothetical protein ACOSQ3_013019 [Xanthoceras sorbifolium]